MTTLDPGARAAALDRVADATPATDKASLLDALRGRVRGARIPPGRVVARAAWQNGRRRALADVLAALAGQRFAVRSARPGEDAVGAGGAGRYRSELDVAPIDLAAAIDAVFASYGAPCPGDQLLVQPYIADIDAALVAASHAPGDGAPYRTISRAAGKDPSAITAGTAAADTVFVAHGTRVMPPRWARRALGVLHEVASVCGGQPFELELVVARRSLWLLQFRPLPAPQVAASELRAARQRARRDLARAARGREPSLFGLMPDWNPAELLGEHPRPLARSLFDALVGRGTWWQARAALGYRRPRHHRLLHTIGGRAYVDVAASFESLLPAAVASADADAAVRAWVRRLAAEPALHDRVELEIAVTCAEFDRMQRLRASGLRAGTARRIDAALREMTLGLFVPQAIAAERAGAEARARCCWPVPGSPRALRAAVEHVRRTAALPFARAARADFVGAALLRSAARLGGLAPDAVDRLRAAAGTVAGELCAGTGDAAAILGALRPGTFDIDAQVPADVGAPATAKVPLAPRDIDLRGLLPLLARDGWAVDVADFVRMAADAARAREVGKLALARAVAALLEGMASFGARLGLDRRTLGWLTLAQLTDPRASPRSLREQATRAQARHGADHALRMPAILRHPDALAVPLFVAGQPSFLGDRAGDGPLVKVARNTPPAQVPPGAVLAIESADPGFDWVFMRRPAGLLTAFGGPQSHMALRCTELAVPAALGIGLPRFERLARSARLRIDPLRRALLVLG